MCGALGTPHGPFSYIVIENEKFGYMLLNWMFYVPNVGQCLLWVGQVLGKGHLAFSLSYFLKFGKFGISGGPAGPL